MIKKAWLVVVVLVMLVVMIPLPAFGLEIGFYAEFLSPDQLQKEEVMELLSRHRIKVYLAISQQNMVALTPVLKEYQEKGIEFILWPLLSEEDGYWPQERNLEKLSQFLDKIFEWAQKNEIELKEILIDFEPRQFQQLAQVGDFDDFLVWARKTATENIDKRRFEESKVKVEEIIRKLHSRGIKAAVTFSNFALEEVRGGSCAAQDFLEAPVFGLPWDRIDFQFYNSSMIEKSRWRHPDLVWALYSLSDRAKKYCKPDISISFSVGLLGLLEPGELGLGFSAEELVIDIGAVLAAGVQKVNIYSLDGLLKLPQPEKELLRILDAQPKRPELTPGAAWFIFLRKMGWFYLRGRQFLKARDIKNRYLVPFTLKSTDLFQESEKERHGFSHRDLFDKLKGKLYDILIVLLI